MPCLNPVTPEQRSHGDPMKNAERLRASSMVASISALPVEAVGSHRTPNDDAHFEHAQNKRRVSSLSQHYLKVQWGCRG